MHYNHHNNEPFLGYEEAKNVYLVERPHSFGNASRVVVLVKYFPLVYFAKNLSVDKMKVNAVLLCFRHVLCMESGKQNG